MYVCICNALKDKELVAAAEADADTVAAAFRHCGRKPQCGKCLSHVADLIEQTRREAAGSAILPAE